MIRMSRPTRMRTHRKMKNFFYNSTNVDNHISINIIIFIFIFTFISFVQCMTTTDT